MRSLEEKNPLLSQITPKKSSPKYVLVIHGGAGTMNRAGSTPAQRAQYHAGLAYALREGYNVLTEGGEALDAVVAAVTAMEDNPLFNSGKGAVFNVAGKNELETSVMLSKPPASHPNIPATRRGMSLTLLTRAKNPSQLVRALYLHPELVPHAALSGAPAEDIGAQLGETLVDPSYFYTENRWKEHRRGLGLPEDPVPYPRPKDEIDVALDSVPTGTVGAVALDVRGCIAALTSTGGKTNKLVGRVGDTPTMGAGFWAEEWKTRGIFGRLFRKKKAVGVSGTGDGDYFIRLATASTLVHRMKFLNNSLGIAGKHVVEELRRDGGVGGVISLDEKGNVSTPLNSSGMYRGVIREDGEAKTAIFDDDVLE
ncbi:asparaginase [Hysterangium stoloniferum]|nr:asparaginase [Hysterangium stoloniferum]